MEEAKYTIRKSFVVDKQQKKTECKTSKARP